MNNASLVMKLTYGTQSFLFMGDAEGKERDDSPDVPRYAEKAMLADPATAAACHKAGLGATLMLDVGGKIDPVLAPPARVTGTVTHLSDGRFAITGPMMTGMQVDMGPTATLKVGGVEIVIATPGRLLDHVEQKNIALNQVQMLVMDEATSSIDTETERQIQAALKEVVRGRTCFVIAHRLSTIRDADQILVVDQGRIVERGSHHDLLAAGGLYADLYRTQFQGQDATASS